MEVNNNATHSIKFLFIWKGVLNQLVSGESLIKKVRVKVKVRVTIDEVRMGNLVDSLILSPKSYLLNPISTFQK